MTASGINSAARSKYRAVRTAVDGITFASKKEAKRYGELRLMEKAGEISWLKIQVPYEIEINGIRVCRYIADFVYDELVPDPFTHYASKKIWKPVVEDCKGMKTATYRLKKKLMLACHGITIKET